MHHIFRFDFNNLDKNAIPKTSNIDTITLSINNENENVLIRKTFSNIKKLDEMDKTE